MLCMLFLIGTFGLNFPIFISTMSVRVFHAGAGAVWTADIDHGGWLGRRRAAAAAPEPGRGIAVLLVGGDAVRGRLRGGRADAELSGCSAPRWS